MFGSVDINSDYTFTQSEKQIPLGNISEALSSYLGNSFVLKTTKEKAVSTDSDTKAESKDETSKAEETFGNDSEEDEAVTGIGYGHSSPITTSFHSLAAATGAVGNKISKNQLISLLQSLTSATAQSDANLQEIAFIKNLIAQFEKLAEGSDYITSIHEVKEPQDYETVTPEQVTPPIDLRI